MGRPGFIPAVISPELGQDLCRAVDSNFLESGYANCDRQPAGNDRQQPAGDAESEIVGGFSFTARCGEFSDKE